MFDRNRTIRNVALNHRVFVELNTFRSVNIAFYLACHHDAVGGDVTGYLAFLSLHRGGTEGTASTKLSGTEWLAHRGSVGKPASGQLKIVGPNGETLPPGETGDVYLKYAEDMQRTYFYIGAESKPITGDWETIGDIGWMDEDGYLYLADRRTDMILVGGSNVYPREVEEVLLTHPAIVEVAVLGVPDPKWGEVGVAVIVSRDPSLTPEAVLGHLEGRCAKYRWPRHVFFWDSLPKSGYGKITKKDVRQMLYERGDLQEPVLT